MNIDVHGKDEEERNRDLDLPFVVEKKKIPKQKGNKILIFDDP